MQILHAVMLAGAPYTLLTESRTDKDRPAKRAAGFIPAEGTTAGINPAARRRSFRRAGLSKKYCSLMAFRNLVCVWRADGIERRGKTGLRVIPERKGGPSGRRKKRPGEGRWTIKAAIDEAVPVPVLTAALFDAVLARRGGVPGQTAVGHAIPVRRTRGETGRKVAARRSPP